MVLTKGVTPVLKEEDLPHPFCQVFLHTVQQLGINQHCTLQTHHCVILFSGCLDVICMAR